MVTITTGVYLDGAEDKGWHEDHPGGTVDGSLCFLLNLIWRDKWPPLTITPHNGKSIKLLWASRRSLHVYCRGKWRNDEKAVCCLHVWTSSLRYGFHRLVWRLMNVVDVVWTVSIISTWVSNLRKAGQLTQTGVWRSRMRNTAGDLTFRRGVVSG